MLRAPVVLATVRFTTERIPEMAATVKAATAELSSLLGHADG